MRKHRNNNEGFTLAELLVAIAVLGVLAASFTPLFIRSLRKSQSVQCLLTRRQVEESVILFHNDHPLLVSFMSFVLLVLWIMVIAWVYRDAERRGMNGVLWALLVLIGNLIGLLIYLIVRSERVPAKKVVQTTTCPSCQKTVETTFIFCPNCGARLQAVCPGCNKPVESSWRVCPHCGERLSK